jgi:nitrile hydratase
VSTEHEGAPTAARLRRLEEAVIEAGLTSDDELDSILEDFLANAKPINGARLIARAWVDDGFRRRLLSDAASAVEEMALPSLSVLRAVENTRHVHNVVVCTLCSCYPVGLLGPSPSWYKSEAYRSRVVREPRAVLAEFGFELDPGVEIRVWDATAEERRRWARVSWRRW